MLKFHTLDNGFESEVGKFKIFIGKNAKELQFAEFELVPAPEDFT
jgi:hypothetical protein